MSEVLLESPHPHVAVLKINRPDKLNSLNMAVREDIAAHVTALDRDETVRVIIITGNEKAQFPASRAAWGALENCRKPLIAAVAGFALGGGCELALHCDIILAAENAKLALREVTIGIMPGAGGTQRFLRAAGSYKAARYLMTGDMMSAQVASEIGLVSEIVPTDQLMERALALAVQIAGLPQLAVHSIKEAIQLGADAPLQTALALERKSFQLLFASDDREEGMGAFLEKRPPDFKGR